MSELFSDPEARERAAKLTRLLGSDAAGEAEAARTALIRLLARHGATADDLAHRLFESASEDAPALRITLAEAERRAALAEAASYTALAEARRLRARARRLRFVAIGAGGFAVLALALALVTLAWPPGPSSPPASLSSGDAVKPPDRPASPPAAPPPTAPSITAPSLSPLPVGPPAKPAPDAAQSTASSQGQADGQALPGRRGKVVEPEGVLLRLDPVPGTPTVAMLPPGTKVVIDQVFPMLGTDWMQVRTEKGAGFVPASTIGPE
jgi:hypothetical protein